MISFCYVEHFISNQGKINGGKKLNELKDRGLNIREKEVNILKARRNNELYKMKKTESYENYEQNEIYDRNFSLVASILLHKLIRSVKIL